MRVTGFGAPKPVRTFAECGFDTALLTALIRAGYKEPTPIQAQALPAALSGRDILVSPAMLPSFCFPDISPLASPYSILTMDKQPCHGPPLSADEIAFSNSQAWLDFVRVVIDQSRPACALLCLEEVFCVIPQSSVESFMRCQPVQEWRTECVVCMLCCAGATQAGQQSCVQGISKTGSGKTAAFVLPLLVHIMDQPELEKGAGPIGIIAAPTRELAEQIHQEARRMSKAYDLRICAAFGGLSKYEQFKDLKAGSEVSHAIRPLGLACGEDAIQPAQPVKSRFLRCL